MPRFEIPARVLVEGKDAAEAAQRAGYLMKAVDAVKGRGYALNLLGAPVEVEPEASRPKCEGCGGDRHDGRPCHAEANTLVP